MDLGRSGAAESGRSRPHALQARVGDVVVDQQTEFVNVELPNGALVSVEIPRRRGGNVGALDRFDFDEVQRIIDGLATVVAESLRRVEPRRATAKLGLSLKVESGKLTGALVQAGGSATLELSLVWERPVAVPAAEDPPPITPAGEGTAPAG